MITTVGHREPTDEIGQPYIRGMFLLRVLMAGNGPTPTVSSPIQTSYASSRTRS